MELCKKVQAEAEECVIRVEKSTNFYTHLQFFLLASTWFPRPLGVCLWSVLHMFLVLCEALMLLALFPIVFVLAVLADAIIMFVLIYCVLLTLIVVISLFLGAFILIFLWLVITCQWSGQCCTIPPKSQDPQPAPVVEGGAAAADEPFGFLKEHCTAPITRRFVNHVILVSFPYRREGLGDLCREIVPWCSTIVI